jgi:hypothetical protein
MPESHIKESSPKLNIVVPPDPLIVFESYMERADLKFHLSVDEPSTQYGKDPNSVLEKHGKPRIMKARASPAL